MKWCSVWLGLLPSHLNLHAHSVARAAVQSRRPMSTLLILLYDLVRQLSRLSLARVIFLVYSCYCAPRRRCEARRGTGGTWPTATSVANDGKAVRRPTSRRSCSALLRGELSSAQRSLRRQTCAHEAGRPGATCSTDPRSEIKQAIEMRFNE
jgi:hypothetical protein